MPPKYHVQIFENKIQMTPVQHPFTKLDFIMKHPSSNIYTFWDIDYFVQWIPNFSYPKVLDIWPWLKNLKIQTWQIPHSCIILNPYKFEKTQNI